METQISRETAANIFDTIGVVTLGGLNNSSEIVENLFSELVEKEISWVFVDKKVLLDDLDSKGHNSDFYSVKDAICVSIFNSCYNFFRFIFVIV